MLAVVLGMGGLMFLVVRAFRGLPTPPGRPAEPPRGRRTSVGPRGALSVPANAGGFGGDPARW